jgi:hypothetical protein
MRKNLLFVGIAGLLALGCDASVAGPTSGPLTDSTAAPVMPTATNASTIAYPDGAEEVVGNWYSVSSVYYEQPSPGPLTGDRYEYVDMQRDWSAQTPDDSNRVRILRLGAFCDSSLFRTGYAHLTIAPTDTEQLTPVQSHLITWKDKYFLADSGVIDVWLVGTDSIEVSYALRYRLSFDTAAVQYIHSSGTYLVATKEVPF